MSNRKINLVNRVEKGRYANKPWILHFGAYGETLCLAYADSLDDALEECASWIHDHAPGLFMNEQVMEAYKEAIKEGKSEEEAQEEAETDMTQVDGGHYLASWEWGILAENPSPAEIAAIHHNRVLPDPRLWSRVSSNMAGVNGHEVSIDEV